LASGGLISPSVSNRTACFEWESEALLHAPFYARYKGRSKFFVKKRRVVVETVCSFSATTSAHICEKIEDRVLVLFKDFHDPLCVTKHRAILIYLDWAFWIR
jgi:hypothetical protein